MKKIIALLLLASVMMLSSGCSFTLSILSNNNILTTRSQAVMGGNAEGMVEGGGSPVVSPTVDVAP